MKNPPPGRAGVVVGLHHFGDPPADEEGRGQGHSELEKGHRERRREGPAVEFPPRRRLHEYCTRIKVLFVSQSISFHVSARFFLINRRVLEVLRTVRRLEAAVNEIKGKEMVAHLDCSLVYTKIKLECFQNHIKGKR